MVLSMSARILCKDDTSLSGACYRHQMSPEALTIIGTGIALAAVNIGPAWLRSDMRHGQTRLEGLGLTGRAEPVPGAGD